MIFEVDTYLKCLASLFANKYLAYNQALRALSVRFMYQVKSRAGSECAMLKVQKARQERVDYSPDS